MGHRRFLVERAAKLNPADRLANSTLSIRSQATRLALLDSSAMLIGMVFGDLAGVVCGMQGMSMSDMGVVPRLLVVAGFVVPGGFALMSCCMFVVFCRLVVVLDAFVFRPVFSFFSRQSLDTLARADRENLTRRPPRVRV
jgi:hypothetical protein